MPNFQLGIAVSLQRMRETEILGLQQRANQSAWLLPSKGAWLSSIQGF